MAFKPGYFSDKQLDVMLNCTAPINALEGSVRSGKTIASLFALVMILPQFPDGNILLVGKTDKTLYRNIILPLQEMFGSKNIVFRRGTGEGEIYGHHFFAQGANDEKAVSKIQGITLSLAYGDEVTTWNESFFQMLLSRLSDKGARFIGTMNPEGPYHWFKVGYLDRQEEIAIKVWKFLLEENKNLPPEYVANLKTYYTGLFYKRYILGEWCLAEGAVYDNFDETVHVAEVKDEIWRNIVQKYISVDYGTTNPTVFQLWGTDGHRRFLRREYYYSSKIAGRQKTDSEYAKDLINFIGAENPIGIIVDPSAASFKAELNKQGLGVMDADNDVLEGIKAVGNELAHRTIIIDPSCQNTIREFGAYVWDVKKCEKGEDAPLKENDHCCFVAGTLITTDHGERPIENIKIGDKVLTRSGYKEVAAAGKTFDNEEVQTIVCNNGKTLTGTRHHPIFVKGKGFIPMDTLRYGDYLFPQETISEFQTLTKSSLMGLSLEDTQVQRNLLTEAIIPQVQPTLSSVSVSCIKRYGNSIMEKYQQDTISTIKTETRLTTALKTLNVSKLVSILANTRYNFIIMKSLPHGKNNTLPKFKNWLKYGMDQKRVNSGTLKMENRHGQTVLQLQKYAKSAGKSIKTLPEEMKAGSVPMPANQHLEGGQALTMKQESACNADQNLQQTNIQRQSFVPQVVQVKPEVKKETVYNLTVKDAHEYFANGILVHNCDALRYFVLTVPIYSYGEGVIKTDEVGYSLADMYDGVFT